MLWLRRLLPSGTRTQCTRLLGEIRLSNFWSLVAGISTIRLGRCFTGSPPLFMSTKDTQRVRIDGALLTLTNPIYHDDRKSIARWFNSQVRYVSLEADRLLMGDRGSFRPIDHVRLLLVPAPLLIVFYTLLVKRCVLDGWPGWYYAAQRLCAELMLSIELLDRRLRSSNWVPKCNDQCARTDNRTRPH